MLTNAELRDEICEAVKDRSQWEEKLVTAYQMRHEGIRRRNKAPWQADLHFPLADTLIAKHTPTYLNSLYASETLSTFFSLQRENSRYARGSEQWFDDKVKRGSNFEDGILKVIDAMLEKGKAIMKVGWDFKKNCLRFESVSPQAVIVPTSTEDLAEADWLCHVKVYSKAAYKRAPEDYAQDEETLKAIEGNGTGQDGTNGRLEDQKLIREGITTAKKGRIVVWEVFERDGDTITVRTFSPLAPDIALRPKFTLPYVHGLMPLIEFNREVKADGGYYASRGIPELVAAFEASLNKLWNEKHDFMTMTNRPIYSAKGLTNASNFRLAPGQVVGVDLKRVELGQPPVSFDQEMINTRMIAEQLTATPDYGMGQQQNTKQPRSATEVANITALMSQIMSVPVFAFRKSIGRLFEQAWSLLCQYAKADLSYFFRDELAELPAEALAGKYRIVPNTSAENWNRQAVFQKAAARLEMFRNDPFINQGELRKATLEADDARLVKTLFQEPQVAVSRETEKQGLELLLMQDGMPVPVDPADDDAAHLKTLGDWFGYRTQMRQAIPPALAQLLVSHASQHWQALQAKNKEQAAGMRTAVRQLVAALAMLASPQTVPFQQERAA